MIFIDSSSSIWIIIYLLTIIVSFIIHKYILLDLLKQYFSSFTLYLILISLLALNNLLLNILYEYISNNMMYIFVIIDGILTAALIAFLITIYMYKWCIFHLFLTLLIIFLSNYYKLNQYKDEFLLNHFLQNLILIIINLLHVLYSFLNGFETYMHRLIGLSGMCISFYIILFQQFNIEYEFPLPLMIIYIVQSIRTFFLYSVVICVRNRTSYW